MMKVNAQANTLMGMGYELASVYHNCVLEFLNVANIHVMRDSLKKLIKSIHDPGGVESSGWLDHIRKVSQHAHPSTLIHVSYRCCTLY
jgi:myotubularin-related protein 1/2